MKDINAIITRLDEFFAAEDFSGAGEYLYAELADALSRKDSLAAVSIYNEIMGFERQYGSPEKAESAARAAMDILEREGLSSSRPAAMIYLNSATVFKNNSKNDAAAQLYERAETLFGRFYPPGAEEFAGLYNNKAALYLDIGEYPKAEYYYGRARSILERYGNTSDLAVTHFNMALLYDAWDPLSGRAEACVNEGMRVLDVPEDKRDAYYFYSCRKCAGAASRLGFFAAAQELDERADRFYARD